MIFEEKLVRALERVTPRHWEGEAWRYVFGASNALLPNTMGARWNPRGTSALYTSLNAETVLAELDHMCSIQAPPLVRSAFRLYRLRLHVDRLLDLRDRAILQEMGVGGDELGGDDHTACQQIGGAAAWLGSDAILVPSARHKGNNLVVFVDQQDPNAPLEVLESREVPHH